MGPGLPTEDGYAVGVVPFCLGSTRAKTEHCGLDYISGTRALTLARGWELEGEVCYEL